MSCGESHLFLHCGRPRKGCAWQRKGLLDDHHTTTKESCLGRRPVKVRDKEPEYFLGSCVEQQKSRSFRGTLCLPPLIVLSYVKPSCALCSLPSSSSRASNKRRKASVRARSSSLRASCSLPPSSLWCADGYKYVQVRSCAARCFFPIYTSLHRHHPDLILCRKPSGIAIGRLCEKCDGRW